MPEGRRLLPSCCMGGDRARRCTYWQRPLLLALSPLLIGQSIPTRGERRGEERIRVKGEGGGRHPVVRGEGGECRL